MHALIIDDNPMNLDVLTLLLNNEGLEAVALNSPRHITDAILAQTRVIFLDLEIPNYDGFDILQDLKGNPMLDGVPIVAYTVHTSEIDVARQAGFHSFLGKPLDTVRFPDQLARILAGQSVWEV